MIPVLCAYQQSDQGAPLDDEGVSVSEVVGPYAWRIIHHAAESFPCDECAEEGGSLMRFAHDLVNHKLGKPVQFPADLERWTAVVAEASSAAGVVPPGVFAALARAGETSSRPTCAGDARERFERCVEGVKDAPGVDNPFAVCTASVGCKLAAA